MVRVAYALGVGSLMATAAEAAGNTPVTEADSGFGFTGAVIVMGICAILYETFFRR